MSKKESKGRLKRRSKSYRRAMMIINIIFTLTIITFGIYGVLHTFTDKKKYRDQGVAEYKNRQYEKAIEFFDKALLENQWFADRIDADILSYKAECHVMLKQYDEASRTYERLKEYPNYVTDKFDIDLLIAINDSFLLFDQGEYEKALPGFVNAYKADYGNLSLYAGICYENMGDLENMHKYYEYYKQLHGADAFLCYKEATYYMSIKDMNPEYDDSGNEAVLSNYEKALASIDEGLSLDDGGFDKELRFAKMVCHEKMNMFEEAYNEAELYVEKYPEDEDGVKLFKYLETRVLPDTTVVNPIYGD